MQVMSALVAEIAGSLGEQAGVGAFLTKAPPALTADRLKSRFSTGVLEHRAHELGWWLHALLALCVVLLYWLAHTAEAGSRDVDVH